MLVAWIHAERYRVVWWCSASLEVPGVLQESVEPVQEVPGLIFRDAADRLQGPNTHHHEAYLVLHDPSAWMVRRQCVGCRPHEIVWSTAWDSGNWVS